MSNNFRIKKIICAQVDLPAFVEQEFGVSTMRISDTKRKSRCPFPYHKDSNPSFSMDKKGGSWVWYCYGCSEGGNVVRLYQKMKSCNEDEAVEFLRKKFDIEDNIENFIYSASMIEDDSEKEREFERSHIEFANVCLGIMRDYPDDRDVIKWVKGMYGRANVVLETKDREKMIVLINEAKKYSES